MSLKEKSLHFLISLESKSTQRNTTAHKLSHTSVSKLITWDSGLFWSHGPHWHDIVDLCTPPFSSKVKFVVIVVLFIVCTCRKRFFPHQISTSDFGSVSLCLLKWLVTEFLVTFVFSCIQIHWHLLTLYVPLSVIYYHVTLWVKLQTFISFLWNPNKNIIPIVKPSLLLLCIPLISHLTVCARDVELHSYALLTSGQCQSIH